MLVHYNQYNYRNFRLLLFQIISCLHAVEGEVFNLAAIGVGHCESDNVTFEDTGGIVLQTDRIKRLRFLSTHVERNCSANEIIGIDLFFFLPC